MANKALHFTSLNAPKVKAGVRLKDTKDMKEETEPCGIGGWLILPMLGLIIAPIRLGILLLTTYVPIFTEGSWEVLTTPGSDSYHSLWAPLLTYEIAGNIVYIVASIVLLVLLFRKHYSFPKWMIIFYATNLAFVGIDFVLADLIPAVAAQQNPESLKELVRTMVGAAIWIPYFIKSQRVQNTFTTGRIEQITEADG